VSADGGYTLNEELYDWLYPARGVWVNWLERQYYFNGRQEPVVINKGPEDFYAQELTLPAPGQLVAKPIAESGNLDGEYIWTYVMRTPCSTAVWSKRCGVLSRPIRCYNEKALVNNFQSHIRDSVCSPGDSTDILVLRTKANKTSGLDTLFRVGLFWVDSGDIWTYNFVDNIADSDLTVAWRTIRDTAYNGEWFGAGWNSIEEWTWGDSLIFGVEYDFGYGWNNAWSPGSPVTVYSDSGCTSGDTVTKAIDVSLETDVTYQIYHVLYFDTLTGAVSDTSRGLWTNGRRSGTGIKRVRCRTIGLPLTPTGRWARILIRIDLDPFESPTYPSGQTDPYFATRYFIDTIYDSAVTEYVDHLPKETVLLDKGAWQRRITDGLLAGAIVHEGRLFAWDKFRVWPSAYDTAAVFSLLDNIAFDLDDGDEIVTCVSFEGYIVVYKNRSVWILYTSDGVAYNRVKASKGFGCVAAGSIDQYAGANLLLGPEGMLFETDSRYRAQSANREYLSNPIKDILLRSIDNMTDAAGKVVNHRYLLSYPGTDTTFVYFLIPGSWGLFTGIDFWHGILYDTAVSAWEEFWFVKDDDERLFVWDESDTTDDGSAYTATWEKRYLSRSSQIKQSLQRVYLNPEASVPAADSLTIMLTDEEGDSLGTFKAPLDKLYSRVPIQAMNNRVVHHLNMAIQAANRDSLKITGLELELTPAGERE
jgi:hypothetical protein